MSYEDAKITTADDVSSALALRDASSSAELAQQTKEVAEVHARLLAAKRFPRDENRVELSIRRLCSRIKFAEQARYSFPRGGDIITGETIRFAEGLAMAYGNIDFGYRELSRGAGHYEVEAFACDLEANTRVSRVFTVKHSRDTKFGVKDVKDERDKYEVVAAAAQRRVRACILALIPGDTIDRALEICRKTEQKGDGRPFADRVREMVVAFDEVGVSVAMLEERLGHALGELSQEELLDLRPIYNSLKQGARRDAFFKTSTSQSKRLVPPTAEKDADSKDSDAAEKTDDSETVDASEMGDPSQLTEEELAELEAAKKKAKKAK